ncbi:MULTISPECIES: hypothetical protein [unclassified Limnothrix]|nr:MULTISPECIES: hypothetical protein [unclassified Limnothrix]
MMRIFKAWFQWLQRRLLFKRQSGAIAQAKAVLGYDSTSMAPAT